MVRADRRHFTVERCRGGVCGPPFLSNKERATKDVAVLGTARQQQGACFGQFRGRELKVYRRSDERIQDVSNRLSHNSSTDASKIQVSVQRAESFRVTGSTAGK
ncbi:hypothetical protein SM2011_b23127 (plasmid) [Sinorhizobium meliloti 2011]|nr:hypothetical protein SM2011_b23127 [Sinorhizobium meliloti 2011]